MNSLGVRLIIWLGKVVPAPLPYPMHRAIKNVEITCDAWNGSGFQITFALSKDQLTEYDLLATSTFAPFSRVIIAVAVGALPEVLIDGVITHHQFFPDSDAGKSTLTITGRDIGVMLDLTEKTKKYENQSDFVIVPQVLAKYATYGIVPNVTPTADVPITISRTPWQTETDLQFLHRMAKRNGYVFYIEPLTFGTNRAYFGPDIRLSRPQPALTLNQGSANNVDSIQFSNDALQPLEADGKFKVAGIQRSLPIPRVPVPRIPPQAMFPVGAKRTAQLRSVANKTPNLASLARVSTMLEGRDPVTGEGTVDITRYGSVLRARRLVGVRGAGASYDGFYFVRRVTHRIQDGAYTQSFSLAREGLGTLTPVVVP